MAQGKLQCPFLVCVEPEHHHIVGKGGEGLAGVFHSPGGKGNARGGVAQVEVTVEVLQLPDAVEIQQQAAQSKVFHAVGADDEVLADDLCGFLLLAREDQVADFLEPSQRARAVVVVRTSAPEGLVVQLYLLVRGAAVDHGSHVGIAQGEGLEPGLRRGVVPEFVLGGH